MFPSTCPRHPRGRHADRGGGVASLAGLWPPWVPGPSCPLSTQARQTTAHGGLEGLQGGPYQRTSSGWYQCIDGTCRRATYLGLSLIFWCVGFTYPLRAPHPDVPCPPTSADLSTWTCDLFLPFTYRFLFLSELEVLDIHSFPSFSTTRSRRHHPTRDISVTHAARGTQTEGVRESIARTSSCTTVPETPKPARR
ncbi:hypothetical protein B0T25DRAFT_25216 [Lasiosphaeria hispida]|uniref:Uncharacterized protein n=1 Tax=Lasiosphaeria hispida TaxID=260671 RepID=A0AAJ0MJX3_9PEZI|nr:hypothetical protein B0T25DRAFT_25216 [Lasiosphaeria hispida]